MAEPFGTAWRASVYHDGRGLQHRPLAGVRARARCTEAERAYLLKVTDEADLLVAKLRARATRTAEYDPRLARVAGKAFARLLRRVWIGKQPYAPR